MAGDQLQCLQQIHRLRRQGHDVGCFHLHPLRRNVPPRRFKIKFGPPRTDQFRSAHKGHGHQLHGEPRRGGTFVGFNMAQQFGQFLAFNSGQVLLLTRRQHIAGLDVGRRVAFSKTMGNGIAKHLAGSL